MSRIKSIQIHNFKFFDEQKAIELGETGKHLLLFGENGSGKSSIYWSLYTLFEGSFKDEDEIKKYFKHSTNHPESLVNIYAKNIKTKSKKTKEHSNSFIKVITSDKKNNKFEISIFNQKISGNRTAQEISKASDYLSYKALFKFQDFWNGEEINLNTIFLGSILPYLKFENILFNRTNYTGATDIFYRIQKEEEQITNGSLRKKNRINKERLLAFKKFTDSFDKNFRDLIDFVNVNAVEIIKKLGYNIDFFLEYKDLSLRPKQNNIFWHYDIKFKVTKYNGEDVNMHRPQSFLNEAKITAIALAIRLAILRRRVNEQAPDILKFIVFDDVMISLDMNNRDKLIDFLLDETNKFTKDYQLLFLTHDKNLFDFVSSKIKKLHNPKEWVFKEMYAGKDVASKKEYPILIDSDLEFIDKAKKYFDAKDYTASAIYIRKELEKIVNERLPAELKYKSDGSFLSLQTLWGNMINRYIALSKPISEEIKKSFDETKLMVLNPQAHFQHISMPIYKVELEKAFDLIHVLKTDYPIPKYTLLLTKGMKLQFKHPLENYTFNFELLSDFYVDELAGVMTPKFPKCGVLKWQYNGTDFWDFHDNAPKIPAKQIEQRLEQIKIRHTANVAVPLNIDSAMFDSNTKIIESVWTLKDLIEKVNIEI
jgi:ABC-type dipeptide/oligopeptide/nickel transport system ATPase subunit